jgi:CheY-like chemotaxis protein
VQIVVNTVADLAMVKADPGQLEHILMNLAVNARDAMPRGGTISIRTGITHISADLVPKHHGSSTGPYVVLSVSDTGSGMDAKTLAHVFEPFFTTKDPGKGTGLGLSMVYGIVKQSGGYITVESAPGQGTTFRIHLPLTGEPEDLPATDRPTTARKAGSGTILLVEDEAAVRQLVNAILTSHGYTVLMADTPAHAMTLCRKASQGIDILLTDVVMPGVTGPDLAKQLLALRPELKVVYMTGYAGESLAEQGLGGDGVSVLQKPFTAAALEEKIRHGLGQTVSS